jgi:hypothetical protein
MFCRLDPAIPIGKDCAARKGLDNVDKYPEVSEGSGNP